MVSKVAPLNVQMVSSTSNHALPSQFYSDRPITEDFTPHANDLSLPEFGGRLCYESWSRPREETKRNKGYIHNILRQKHFSVLEHVTVGFYIEGVSRSLTHEFVRHRHFSYSQLSQRFVDSSKARFVVPPALSDDEVSVMALQNQFNSALETYDAIVEQLTKKGAKRKQIREAARSVLPNMTETKILVTGNLRAWMEFLVKRDNPAADAEIARLAKEIGRQLASKYPSIFDDGGRALWDESFAQREVQSWPKNVITIPDGIL